MLFPFPLVEELGPHVTQCRLGWGLPLYQPSGLMIHPAVWPQ